MTVLVAMPYFGHAQWVDRAIRSVLAQTVRDIHLLVLGDGEEPPVKVRDSRVDVAALPSNRGTYFARQVMLAASPHEWYAPVDADDWVEPDHLERLMAQRSDAVATGAVWWHQGERVRVWTGPGTRRAYYHVGLFTTERLRGIGGYDPGERIGQDTLILRMLRVSGRLTRYVADPPTYHRYSHPGTLTTHPDTSLRSRMRSEMRERNLRVYRAADQLGTADRIRDWRLARIKPEVSTAVAEQAERLSAHLGRAVAA